MMEPWASELTPSMLTDGLLRSIAEKIGTDNLLELSLLVGGQTFYMPQKESILRPLRDMKIREEYNGYNTADLARKYDVSHRRVQQIVKQAEH